MTDIPQDVPEAKRGDYERGVALLVNVSHERDEALGRCHEALAQCDRLRADIAARDATIAALKDMLSFTEQQFKLRDAEHSTRVMTYQAERDTAIKDLAEADACLNMLAEAVLTQVRTRGTAIASKEQPSHFDVQ